MLLLSFIVVFSNIVLSIVRLCDLFVVFLQLAYRLLIQHINNKDFYHYYQYHHYYHHRNHLYILYVSYIAVLSTTLVNGSPDGFKLSMPQTCRARSSDKGTLCTIRTIRPSTRNTLYLEN
jgi:hypothetical protein